MGYIPKDAKWYLAELVMEITVAHVKKNVVHRNLTLIRANSPEKALMKSHRFGLESETRYKNSEGRLVVHRFRGVSKLDVVVWGLRDGAELTFYEQVGMSSQQIDNMIPDSSLLEVFRPAGLPVNGEVNYVSQKIMNQIQNQKKAVSPQATAVRLSIEAGAKRKVVRKTPSKVATRRK